jgi:hypothetical protein
MKFWRKKKTFLSWVWWGMPVISALNRLKWEDLQV